MAHGEWQGSGGEVGVEVTRQSETCLQTYAGDPKRVEQDATIERSIAEGGYGRKQVYELVQNGADAMLGAPGRIEVVLTDSCLYVANEGRPITIDGVHALMASHLSRKRGDEIGRFGLGFKSVVALSDRPEVYSRTGSFAFDRADAEKRIRAVVPDAPDTPTMRLARALDPHERRSADDVLDDLMAWATTVIRVPVDRGAADLKLDISDFPAEFLLFSPHAERLTLRSDKVQRELSVSAGEDGVLSIKDGAAIARWRIGRRQHHPSSLALADAGAAAHREAIAVQWAAPLQNRSALGRLWAFFPTADRTTLSGIVNAPWKLGDDRRNLLEGPFNLEILETVLPSLVEEELRGLVDSADPCSYLELLPGRGRESRSWADDKLNGPVMDRLSRAPSLPDMTGALRSPETMRLHPSDLPSAALEAWRSLEPSPSGWVHHSVDSGGTDRRARAERLLNADGPPDAATWVAALVETRTAEGSAAALRVIATLRNHSSFDAVRKVPSVLLEDGSVAEARPGRVFIRSSAAEVNDRFLHPTLAADQSVLDILAGLGIRLVDRLGELRAALSLPNERIDWRAAWSLSRQCDPDQVHDAIKEEVGTPVESAVKVRNRDGRFVPMSECFLPGGVVSPHDRGHSRWMIDTDWHRDDVELLDRLGAVAQPVRRAGTPKERWLAQYEEAIVEKYIADSTGAKPRADRLVVNGEAPPWPLQMLPQLKGEAAAHLTATALDLMPARSWTVRHATNATHPTRPYKDPTLWWLHQHGVASTGVGPFPLRWCVANVSNEAREDVFPVADVSSDVVSILGLPTSLEDMPEKTWDLLFERARVWDESRRTHLYAWASYYLDAPESLVVRVAGNVRAYPPAEVAVTQSAEDFRSLSDQRTPTLLVESDEDVKQLIENWGLEDGRALLEQELAFDPTGEPQVLTDAYPRLRLFDVPSSIKIQYCDSIELVTETNKGTISRPIDSYLNEDVLLTTTDEPRRMLRQASDALQLGLSTEQIDGVIEHLRSQELEKAIAEVRSVPDVEKKLALLLGTEAMTSKVPLPALEAVRADLDREPTATELARLVLAVHGVRVLHAFSSVLEDKGMNPPSQWVGGSATRRFVSDLGFPPEYAGFVTTPKPAMHVIDGPAPLPDLHDYQQIVTSKIKAMLRGSTEAKRGLVSLPTGAGKTRVAVQALVEEIAEGNLGGPIVWIAQSDELCEQAVETWSYIWRSRGSARGLHVSRLWSGNEADEKGTEIQLVVATPQKLLVCKGKENYEWLTGCSVVVVDEAHTSVSTMYTQVLEWLGLGRSRKNMKPLIGLTATPFRNTNEAETRQLAARYDHNRLDEGAFMGDPHVYLQERRILARAHQRVLDGADVVLTASELADVEKFKDLPRTALTRLGTNVNRNETIVQSIAELPDDWTVLVFATSVDNARVLAALLSFRGISAVSIEANTDAAARRHYIEEFKASRIRVITNYGVLAQGFDAPAVRAVYVTRPTFSANLYQQMIGRGLRGPKNGGSDEVLIVNVEDNVTQYGEALAFTGFDHVWKKDG